MFKKVLAGLALAAVGVTLAAGTAAVVTWGPPTAYSDGTTLAPADIAFYTVTWGTNTVKVTPPAVTANVTVPCGSTSFSVTVTTTATAFYPNATSSPAGPVPYATGIACVPNPPQGLAVH